MNAAKFPANVEGLKDAIHADVLASVPKALAEAMGVGYSTLMQWADPTEDKWPPMRRLPALARLASSHRWLDVLEAHAGRVAHRIPPTHALCSVQTIEALKEFADFLASVSESVADGTLTEAEAQRIEHEGREAMAAIAAVIDTAQRQVPPRMVKLDEGTYVRAIGGQR